jgi:hypothetical protein
MVNGVQYGDLNANGVVDVGETAELNPAATGLALTNAKLALGVFKDTAVGSKTRYVALKASADQVGIVGIDAFQAQASKVEVSLNIATGAGTTSSSPVIDFKESWKRTSPAESGFIVQTGATPITLSSDHYEIHASANNVLVDLSGFVRLQGNVAFDFGDRKTVTVNTGIPSAIGTLAEPVRPSLNSALEMAQGDLSSIKRGVSAKLGVAVDSLKSTLNGAINGVVDTIAAQISSTLTTALQDAKGSVGGDIQNALTSATSSIVDEMASQLIDPFIAGITSVVPAGALRSLVEKAVSPVKSKLRGLLEEFLDEATGGAVDRITAAVSEAMKSGVGRSTAAVKTAIHGALAPEIAKVEKEINDLKASFITRLEPLFADLEDLLAIRFGENFATVTGIEVDVMALGISNATAFVGLPPPA